MMNQQGINQAPVQYVMMGNQMVAVQAIYPQQPMGQAMYPTFIPNPNGQQFQPVSGVPEGCAVPSQMYPQTQQNNPVGMINPNVNQSDVDVYRKNVTCYVLTFLFFFVACIILQFVLYGSRVAARLWIASYVFLIVTLILFHARQEKIIWNVRAQALFLCVSLVLEIAGFAVAVSHPVLYDYEKSTNSEYIVYNDRRRLQYYDYSYCQDLYYNLNYSDYEYYYGSVCDPILGRSDYNSDENYDYNDNYYYGYDSIEGNMCSGYYDPYRTYCFPLQIGILVYNIFNLIFYLMVYVALIRRIRHYSLLFKKQHIVAAIHTNPQVVIVQAAQFPPQSQIISQQPYQ